MIVNVCGWVGWGWGGGGGGRDDAVTAMETATGFDYGYGVRMTVSMRAGGEGGGGVEWASLSRARAPTVVRADVYGICRPYAYAHLRRLSRRLNRRALEGGALRELTRPLALRVDLRVVFCDPCPLGLLPAGRRAAGGRLCSEPLVGKDLQVQGYDWIRLKVWVKARPLTRTSLRSQCLHVAPGACEELRLPPDQCAPSLEQAIFSTGPVCVFVICARRGFARVTKAHHVAEGRRGAEL